MNENNIYLLEQDENTGYDTYDSAVVIASSETIARTMHPLEDEEFSSDCWASRPEFVKVTLLGQAIKEEKKRIVCSSFNEG